MIQQIKTCLLVKITVFSKFTLIPEYFFPFFKSCKSFTQCIHFQIVKVNHPYFKIDDVVSYCIIVQLSPCCNNRWALFVWILMIMYHYLLLFIICLQMLQNITKSFLICKYIFVLTCMGLCKYGHPINNVLFYW